jgi:hypothetical protein
MNVERVNIWKVAAVTNLKLLSRNLLSRNEEIRRTRMRRQLYSEVGFNYTSFLVHILRSINRNKINVKHEA